MEYVVCSSDWFIKRILFYSNVDVLITVRNVNSLWRYYSDCHLKLLEERCCTEIPPNFLQEFLAREEVHNTQVHAYIYMKWLAWKNMNTKIYFKIDVNYDEASVFVHYFPNGQGTMTVTFCNKMKCVSVKNGNSEFAATGMISSCLYKEHVYILTEDMLIKNKLADMVPIFRIHSTLGSYKFLDMCVFNEKLLLLSKRSTTTVFFQLSCHECEELRYFVTSRIPVWIDTHIFKIYSEDVVIAIYHDFNGTQLFEVFFLNAPTYMGVEEVLTTLNNEIVSVFRYGRTFIVGLSDGRVLFYDVDDWRKFSLKNIVKCFYLEGFIENIDVCEKNAERRFVVTTNGDIVYKISGLMR